MEEFPCSPTKELFSPLSPPKHNLSPFDKIHRNSRSNSINSLKSSDHGKIISSEKIVKQADGSTLALEKSLQLEKNKNEMLEKINQSLQNYIEEIEKKVEEKISNESNKSELQAKVVELANQNDKLIELISQSQSEKFEFVSKIEDLESQIEEAEAIKGHLEMQNSKLVNELENSRRILSPLRASVLKEKEQEGKQESLLEEIKEFKQKLREKDKELFKTRELLQFYEGQVPSLKQKLDEKDIQLQKLICELEDLTSEAKMLERKNCQLSQELLAFKSKSPNKFEVSTLKKLRDEEEEVSLNFSQLEEKDENKALKELNIDLCEQIERLKAKLLSKEKEEVFKGKSISTNEKSKIEELEYRLKKKDETIIDLQTKIKKTPFNDKSNISQIQSLENFSCFSEQFQAEKSKLLTDLSHAKSSKKQIKVELVSANKNLEKFKEENAKLAKKCAKYHEELLQWRSFYYNSCKNQDKPENEKTNSQKQNNLGNYQNLKEKENRHLYSNSHSQPVQMYSNLYYTAPILRSPTNYNRLMSPKKSMPQYSLKPQDDIRFKGFETSEQEKALISKYEV